MSKKSVLASYIYQLAELPPHPPIMLETVEQQAFFYMQGQNWQAISLWLRHLLLGESLQEEVYLTEMLYQQPRAELMAAEFKLAVGVHPRSAHPVICSFKSPAELWFNCQLQLSYGLLQYRGLLEPPEIKGKTERLNGTRRFINQLESYKFADWKEERTKSQSSQLVLIVEAQDIAKVDANFDLTYYKPFLRQFRHMVSSEKNNERLQDVYLLPSGEIYRTGKGGKLPKLNCKEK